MIDPKISFFMSNQIRRRPEIANSGMGQNFLNVLQTGDENAGIALANNILQSYGISREEGLGIAMQMFHL